MKIITEVRSKFLVNVLKNCARIPEGPPLRVRGWR
jgi:hypothetical protein